MINNPPFNISDWWHASLTGDARWHYGDPPQGNANYAWLQHMLHHLKPGGRAAVIVPDGVLFGSSKAHKDLRRLLVEENKLDAVIKLPSGVFRPYAGVSTAILVFTRTGVGGTDHVWFYDVRADGWSLDDKRQPLLSDDKLGPAPVAALTGAEAAKNDLPDLVKRWAERDGAEREVEHGFFNAAQFFTRKIGTSEGSGGRLRHSRRQQSDTENHSEEISSHIDSMQPVPGDFRIANPGRNAAQLIANSQRSDRSRRCRAGSGAHPAHRPTP